MAFTMTLAAAVVPVVAAAVTTVFVAAVLMAAPLFAADLLAHFTGRFAVIIFMHDHGPVAVVLFAVAGRVGIVVPVILHEVHGTAAGVVVGAVARPVAAVAFRHAQIHGGAHHALLDDDGLRVVHGGRREAADIELAVKARLAHAEVDAGLGGRGGGGRQAQGQGGAESKQRGLGKAERRGVHGGP